MFTFESYALESYQIWDDPNMIAFEATIEGNLGNTKIARKEKRLLAAVKNEDEAAAKEIKESIDEDVEKLRKAAKAERNRKIAQAAISVAGAAATVASMIVSHKRDIAERNAITEILGRNNGTMPRDVQTLLDARNAHANVAMGAKVVGTVANALGGIL